MTTINFTAIDSPTIKDHCYFGDNGNWLIVNTITRDSDDLDVSNHRVMLERLGGVDNELVTTETESHWAYGWVKHILVNPTATDKLELATELNRYMVEEYSVLSDDDYSQLQWDNANECGYSYDCYTGDCGECEQDECNCACHI